MKYLQLILLGTLGLCAWEAPAMPKGELARMVKLGNSIANDTANHPLTKEYVGNTLACKYCHLQDKNNGYAGTASGLSTWIGTAAVFPAYSKREKTIQTVEDRSNNCFMRSMSGKRLEDGSEASLALAAYITWLSTGIPMKMDENRPVTSLKSQFYADGQKKFRAIVEKSTHENYLNGKKCIKQNVLHVITLMVLACNLPFLHYGVTQKREKNFHLTVEQVFQTLKKQQCGYRTICRSIKKEH